jgi:NADPH:quinone reductase-like Zn-dependent oxidoreductase
VRAIVYTGTSGRQAMGLEERPDPLPGSEELLVAVRFAAMASSGKFGKTLPAFRELASG